MNNICTICKKEKLVANNLKACCDCIKGNRHNVLKEIEKSLGRKKTIPKGPRIIDMDILLYNNIILNSPELTIPHPQIKNREFILKHLLEIDHYLIDPETGIPYIDIYREKYKSLLQ